MSRAENLVTAPRSHLVFEWQEIGEPPVVAVGESNCGTSTIRDLITYEFGGTVDFVLAPEGGRCRLELPSGRLGDDGQPFTRLACVGREGEFEWRRPRSLVRRCAGLGTRGPSLALDCISTVASRLLRPSADKPFRCCRPWRLRKQGERKPPRKYSAQMPISRELNDF